MTTRNAAEHTLHDYVQLMLEAYFEQLGDQEPSNMYTMTIAEVEKALLKTVLKKTKHNQSTASKYLGLNRTTLRKKLKEYDLYHSI